MRWDPNYTPPPTLEESQEKWIKANEGSRSHKMRSLRYLTLNDFWFANRYIFATRNFICKDENSDHYGKHWYDHPWLFNVCREFQEDPDGWLDLWSRQHMKTTTITENGSKWEIIRDPSIRIALITYKADKVGESFFKAIRKDLQENELLKSLFPDVFYADPEKEATTWNSSAIVVKRPMGPREPTVSFFSLVGSQPVSQHYDLLKFDDIVTRDNAYTQDQIKKTTEAWRHSAALAGDTYRFGLVGTRWSMHDSYKDIIESGMVKVRVRPLYDENGKGVLRSNEWIDQQRTQEGPVNFAAQYLNNPIAEGQQTFDMGWRKYYDTDPESIAFNGKCNVYILIDPARVTKKDTDPDYTVIAVVGVIQGNPRKRFYLLDLIRDRIALDKSDDILFELVEKWKPNCVLLERIGADVRLDHIKLEMGPRGMTFRIYPFFEHSGIGKIKAERIKRLQTSLAAGDWFFPSHGIYKAVDGVSENILDQFYEEEMRHWTPEGGSRHDDILDTLSWVHSPAAKYLVVAPRRIGRENGKPWSPGQHSPYAKKETSAWAV